jgi:hypothetical protein
MPEPEIVLSGLGIPESPRWHEGRLWFCNWIDRQVVAADMDGEAEVMLTRGPASHPMGYSIDWLPDGRLLITGAKLERQEPDGSMVTIAGQHANEIVVDAAGNAYVNGADFDFVAGAPPEPGYIKLITHGGDPRPPGRGTRHPAGRDRSDPVRLPVVGRLPPAAITAPAVRCAPPPSVPRRGPRGSWPGPPEPGRARRRAAPSRRR